MSESFADLFEESLNTIEMAPGSIVTGTVVDIDDDWVVVHAGLKSEGVIPKNQFLNEEGVCTLSIGDRVKVAMDPGAISMVFRLSSNRSANDSLIVLVSRGSS
jgi:small subunit ribosomal protein S1